MMIVCVTFRWIRKRQVTPAYSLSYDGGQTYAFSPAVADGTGQLVRACAQSTGTKVCSKGW